MSTPEISDEAVADYICQGYDLESARRLAEFDAKYIKYLAPETAELYLEMRKKLKEFR